MGYKHTSVTLAANYARYRKLEMGDDLLHRLKWAGFNVVAGLFTPPRRRKSESDEELLKRCEQRASESDITYSELLKRAKEE